MDYLDHGEKFIVTIIFFHLQEKGVSLWLLSRSFYFGLVCSMLTHAEERTPPRAPGAARNLLTYVE